MTFSRREKRPDPEQLFIDAYRYEESGDFRNAFKRLLASALLGHVLSQVNLGNFYAWGRGVRRSPEKAAYWYKKAYKSGDSDGALNLAIDKKKEGNNRGAVIWLKKAAAMNSGEACVELAKIYSKRKGGQRTAASFLQQALGMNRSEVSDSTKEEAESLLKTIAE